MAEFELTDFKLGGKKIILQGEGIAEVMLDYLPWPSLDVRIIWFPSVGIYKVTDMQTDFEYGVVLK